MDCIPFYLRKWTRRSCQLLLDNLERNIDLKARSWSDERWTAFLYTCENGHKEVVNCSLSCCHVTASTSLPGERLIVRGNQKYGNPEIFKKSFLECLFPPWKNDVTEDFFFSSGRSVSEGSLYPRGSSLRTSEARAVIETQGGKGCPRIHFCLRRQKNPR